MAPLIRSHSHPSRSNSSTLLCLFRCWLHCQVRERLDSLGIPVSATYIRSSFLFLLRSLSFPLMNVLNTQKQKKKLLHISPISSKQSVPLKFCSSWSFLQRFYSFLHTDYHFNLRVGKKLRKQKAAVDSHWKLFSLKGEPVPFPTAVLSPRNRNSQLT